MQVVRESACQRRHHRVTAPLRITSEDGGNCIALNWSLGGLKVADWPGPGVEPGASVKLELHIPFQGFEIAFHVVVCVVRIDEDNPSSFAAEFIELPQRASELMRHFIDDLVRGKMASVEDTICRIDVPVTPISTKPDVNPSQDMPIKRWPVKTIIMSSLYIVFGIFVFGYAGLLLYTTLMRLEVKRAVVSAPLVTVTMPVAGQLQSVSFEKGTWVEKGDLIAHIVNPALERKIEMARQNVVEAQDALLRVEQKARVEQERMKLYQLVSETDYNISAARIEAHREALNAADAHFVRIQKLVSQGHMAQSKLDEAKHRQSIASSRLMEAELVHQQASAMRSASKRRHYNHKTFVVDLDLVELEISAARSALNLAASRLDVLLRQKSRQHITAPVDGQIVALFSAPDIQIERNTPLLTIETSSDLSVTAFLSQEDILKIGLAKPASIFLPALGEYVEGRIVSIDRNATALDPEANHYQWQNEDKPTAIVSIKLNPAPSMARQIRAGLPAIVTFERAATGVASRVSHWFRSEEEQDVDTNI